MCLFVSVRAGLVWVVSGRGGGEIVRNCEVIGEFVAYQVQFLLSGSEIVSGNIKDKSCSWSEE